MSFDSAARLVLDCLTTNVPLALWSVTRVANGRQTFLYVNEDNSYAKTAGPSYAGRGGLTLPDRPTP